MASKIKSSHERPAEHYHGHKGYECYQQEHRVLHPEHRRGKENVAQCAASDGGDESYDVGAEPVETLGRGQAYARYCEGYGAYYFDCENEKVAFVHSLFRLGERAGLCGGTGAFCCLAFKMSAEIGRAHV